MFDTLFYLQGWTCGQAGPSFVDLQVITRVSLDSGSAFFTASGIGYLIGSLLTGCLYDRIKEKIVLVCAALCGLGTTVAIIPWMTVYEAMVFMFLLFGISAGLLDTSKTSFDITQFLFKEFQ